MKKSILLPGILALACVCCGCMSEAEIRAKRIEKNQSYFIQLPPDVQARVSNGQIAVGDTETAVFLALGQAGNITSVATSECETKTWRYFRSVPVEKQVLVYPPPPPPAYPGMPPPPPPPPYYEWRTVYVSQDWLNIVFVNGRVTEIRQY